MLWATGAVLRPVQSSIHGLFIFRSELLKNNEPKDARLHWRARRGALSLLIKYCRVTAQIILIIIIIIIRSVMYFKRNVLCV